MTTIDDRVSRIEGALPYLATKEDLAHLETRLIKWLVGAVLGAVLAAAGVSTALATVIVRVS